MKVPRIPKVGQHVECGYFPQNYHRGRVLAVLLDEPAKGSWVAVVRTWLTHKRDYHYDVVSSVAWMVGVWRPSPRKPSWDELREMARAGK